MIPESEKKIHCDAIDAIDIFAGAYREALVGYVGSEPAAEGQVTLLAKQSRQLELPLIDLAGIHEGAVRECRSGDGDLDGEAVKRGKTFFAKVAAAASSGLATEARVESLARQVEELALSNRQLREEVDRRKSVEESLRKREKLAGEQLGKSRERQEEWRLLSRRLLTVQEDEQKLISRELHDVIAQTMTGINVRLAVLRSQATASAIELHRMIAETERLAEKSVEIVHQFASELHPAVLDDFGLPSALRTFVESFTARSGVPVEITAGPGADDLPAAIRGSLYRIAREALGKLSPDAGDRPATVRISRTASFVRMEIADNGRGLPFSTGPSVFTAGDPDGETEDGREALLGLLGMKERAGMVGGTLQVHSHPGGGTTMTVEVPLAGTFAEVDFKRNPLSTSSLT